MNELALFAGAGILAAKLLGWRTVCAVELDAYCRRVLLARQRDGMLPRFPIWDDVRSFDGKPWRGHVDVISGGFPCQDISCAGKGKGIEGKRSGLWFEFARIIREVRPQYVFVENSPMLTSRGLGVVLGDLAAMGFDARWGVLGADDVGASHRRKRIWIVAHDSGQRWGEGRSGRSDSGSEGQQQQTFCADASNARDVEWSQQPRRRAESSRASEAELDWDGPQGDMANAEGSRLQDARRRGGEASEHARPPDATWWTTEPDVGRVAHGVASRVDRLRALGNGQVPAVAAFAWGKLKD